MLFIYGCMVGTTLLCLITLWRRRHLFTLNFYLLCALCGLLFPVVWAMTISKMLGGRSNGQE